MHLLDPGTKRPEVEYTVVAEGVMVTTLALAVAVTVNVFV